MRTLRAAPTLLVFLALGLLGVELARLFWILMPDGPAWQPPPARTQSASAQRKAFDLQPLLSANLYGSFAAETVAVAEVDPEDAPDTKLRLTLRGIVAAETPESSRALIESNPNELQPYAIGADIPGGASLHSIYPDRVLLKRGGRLETLRLEKDLPTDPTAVVALPDSRRQGLPAGTQILDAAAAAKLSDIRTELLNDPTKASRYMRMQPARRDGSLVGYRIYPGRDRKLFSEMGLRPGDILTRVNGVDLNDPSRSLQLLGELSQASNVDVTIERAGNQQSFSVSLSQ